MGWGEREVLDGAGGEELVWAWQNKIETLGKSLHLISNNEYDLPIHANQLPNHANHC